MGRGPHFGVRARRRLQLRNGERVRTVDAPPEAPVVWFLGGSTMFGVGQRDDHTIPNEVARLAAADGRPVTVVNLAVESWVNWQETLRFIELLTLGRQPDVVVFYDGVNELGSASERVRYGVAEPDEIGYNSWSPEERKRLQEQGESVESSEVDRRRDETDVASRQYHRGVELARLVGGSCGVLTLHFWQPTLISTRPGPATRAVADHLGINAEGWEAGAAQYAEVLSSAPRGVVDLSGIFDGAAEPLFFDMAHTNEAGAARVAAAIWPVIRDRLTEVEPHDSTAVCMEPPRDG